MIKVKDSIAFYLGAKPTLLGVGWTDWTIISSVSWQRSVAVPVRFLYLKSLLLANRH
jgi:hypothetical protein